MHSSLYDVPSLERGQNEIYLLVQSMIAHQQELQQYVYAVESRVSTIEASLSTAAPSMNGEEAASSTNRASATGMQPDMDSAPVSPRPQSDSDRTVEPSSVSAPKDEGLVYYTLQESIWDLAFLIGLPGTGSLGSAFVALLVTFNSLMQLYLCVIINDIFTVPTIDSNHASAMREWRLLFGHSIEGMNPYSNAPYVQDICSFSNGIQFSSQAADVLNSIAAYTPEIENYEGRNPIVGPYLPHNPHIGVMMSSCAVLIWLMQLSVHLVEIKKKGGLE